ncbi:hypothetical protein AC578_4999 [Pseudocercospora eumusae]|uniref:Uncharacterized protein n=1 Tax=Pseudocercospora eumusae TaxID=321146 RepID=A0A139H959_9PEZI|nr:hypothetical protein AC578_4999 [Pseudocercospora eumusae]
MPKRKTEEVDYLDTSTKRSRISIADLTERNPSTKANNGDAQDPQQTQSTPQDDSTVYIVIRKSPTKHGPESSQVEVAIEGVFRTKAAAIQASEKICHHEEFSNDQPQPQPHDPKPGSKSYRVWEISFQKTEIWVEERVFGDVELAEESDSKGYE